MGVRGGWRKHNKEKLQENTECRQALILAQSDAFSGWGQSMEILEAGENCVYKSEGRNVISQREKMEKKYCMNKERQLKDTR